jgi:RNA 2',3'-cyclic 3'-phosphodiesterase
VRLFVALDLPDAVRSAIGETIALLKRACREARWVRPEGMHVTLKFIGHAIADGETQKLEALRAALASVRLNGPVEMQFRGLGFFPNRRRPRVIWCGVEASDNLTELALGVERVLETLGIPAEKRRFTPHLTLARLKDGGTAKLAKVAEEMKLREFGSGRETEFHLFQSCLKPSGAEYKKIESYSFARKHA